MTKKQLVDIIKEEIQRIFRGFKSGDRVRYNRPLPNNQYNKTTPEVCKILEIRGDSVLLEHTGFTGSTVKQFNAKIKDLQLMESVESIEKNRFDTFDKEYDWVKNVRILYPKLTPWNGHHFMREYNSVMNEQLIKEFNSTISNEITIKTAIKRFGDILILKHSSSLDTILFEFKQLNEKNLETINKFMDSFGWYPSYIGHYTSKEGKYSEKFKSFIGDLNVLIEYNPKYNIKIDIKKPLYHITPDIYYSEINRRGLTPKSKSKIGNHPERIYLLHGETDFTSIADELVNKSPYKNRIKESYIIKINPDYIKTHTFFADSKFDMGDAVWTYENIPPVAIEVIGKIPNLIHDPDWSEDSKFKYKKV